MTPDEIQALQDQIQALDNSLLLIRQMIAGVEDKMDAEHQRRRESDETLLLIANQLIRLGEGTGRIGDELASLARELRSKLEPPKKKRRMAVTG